MLKHIVRYTTKYNSNYTYRWSVNFLPQLIAVVAGFRVPSIRGVHEGAARAVHPTRGMTAWVREVRPTSRDFTTDL